MRIFGAGSLTGTTERVFRVLGEQYGGPFRFVNIFFAPAITGDDLESFPECVKRARRRIPPSPEVALPLIFDPSRGLNRVDHFAL